MEVFHTIRDSQEPACIREAALFTKALLNRTVGIHFKLSHVNRFVLFMICQIYWMNSSRGKTVSCTIGPWGKDDWISVSSTWSLKEAPNRSEPTLQAIYPSHVVGVKYAYLLTAVLPRNRQLHIFWLLQYVLKRKALLSLLGFVVTLNSSGCVFTL